MCTFTPPTTSWAWPTDNPLLDRLPLPRGLTVITDGAGGWYTDEFPWQGTLQNLTEGVGYFLGGHTYVVSEEVGESLAVAGYHVDCTGAPYPATDLYPATVLFPGVA